MSDIVIANQYENNTNLIKNKKSRGRPKLTDEQKKERKEEMKLYFKNYRKQNKEQLNQYKLKFYYNNKEACLESSKKYYNKIKEQAKLFNALIKQHSIKKEDIIIDIK